MTQYLFISNLQLNNHYNKNIVLVKLIIIMSSRVFQDMKSCTESPVKVNKIHSRNDKLQEELNEKSALSFNRAKRNDLTYRRGITITVYIYLVIF